MASASSSGTGVPPGFRFHPTDEELLLYYLKKKISLEKFDLDVVREVDLNKIEPWDLQERCRIGATPQNEWYFFSHKDRKYPTGSRTNRATNAGFWKATGRDKCIRTSYRKIGMRKTLVFYRGRAPHGQKTDWIMHEYRLEESDEDLSGGSEDGWVVCRVFKKKCFFKAGGSEGSSSQGGESAHMNINTVTSHDVQSRSLYMNQHHQNFLHHFHSHQATSLYKPELGLQYPHQLAHADSYTQVQVQDLLPNHRPSAYDFSVLPADHSSAAAIGGGLDVDGCEPIQNVGHHHQNQNHHQERDSDWAMMDNIEQGRFGNAAAAVQPMNQIAQQRGGAMDLWPYGK